jgi:hypothetical protein
MSNPKKNPLDKLAKKIGIRSEAPGGKPTELPGAVLEDHLEMIAAAHLDIHNSAHHSVPSPN